MIKSQKKKSCTTTFNVREKICMVSASDEAVRALSMVCDVCYNVREKIYMVSASDEAVRKQIK